MLKNAQTQKLTTTNFADESESSNVWSREQLHSQQMVERFHNCRGSGARRSSVCNFSNKETTLEVLG